MSALFEAIVSWGADFDLVGDFVARFPDADFADFFPVALFASLMSVAGEVASDVSGALVAAASFSLGDSSSTIICQRISRRIPLSVHPSSKKVNKVQLCSNVPFAELEICWWLDEHGLSGNCFSPLI
ncbi:MAG: hypothetical protein MI807_23615 [Verrucomicrobiales bacterium]|nr:hypothetical protein [Verrucomicrobiales bacterium]